MRRTILAVVATASMAAPSVADAETTASGEDLYAMGTSARPDVQAPRDLFAAGARVAVRGSIAGDLHAAGFDVEVEAPAAGDLYAAGGSVDLRAPVGGDATAMGGSVTLARDASAGGNARLSGGTVTVEDPVAGALVVAGGEVLLDAAVEGDVAVAAGALTFGPDARIGGTLRHAGPEPVAVPEAVIPADRVSFERISRPEVLREAGEGFGIPEAPVLSGRTAAGAAAIGLGFLVVLGAVLLAFAPRTVAGLRRRATARPWLCLLLEALGLSALLGLVPVGAMTLVGLPLLPVVALAVVLAWILGYLLGAYAVAMRVAQALGAGAAPPIWLKLIVLDAGVALAAALNLVPVLGWLANLALILLGIGAVVAALLERSTTRPDPARDENGDPARA